MSMMIRQAQAGDVQAIQKLRMSVRENVLVDPSLVTEDITTRAITQEGRGWVAMETGRLLGFSIALPAKDMGAFRGPGPRGPRPGPTPAARSR